MLKTGITCRECNNSFHFRCAKIDSSVKENNEFTTSWNCIQCCLKNSGKITNAKSCDCKCEFSAFVEDLIREIQCLKAEVTSLNKKVNEIDRQCLLNGSRPKSKTKECFPTIVTQNRYQILDEIPMAEVAALKSVQTKNNRSNCKKIASDNFKKRQVPNSCINANLVSEHKQIVQCNDSEVRERNDSVIHENVCKKLFQNGSRSEKNQKYKKGRILIYGDSHGREIAQNIVNIQDDFTTVAHIQPGAPLSAVVKPCVQDSESFSANDYVVIIGGTNDVAKNQANDAIRHMKITLVSEQKNCCLTDDSTTTSGCTSCISHTTTTNRLTSPTSATDQHTNVLAI
ncbi:uncharacterized protein LOC126335369 isoform X1 [Schistocerca gregaria]|uniref:uncharacterized protein LOC126335369 isoform X1 n=1 Tax=Schistocerca gregaria TaxID=7010 RepID=UPI00211DAA7B|nr:uncharacterized protein LOC126335369 isoform X1 [Schistocerca gregaria]XP_049854532.1 uncharacterized protein LOC126335369 isoform X1 [Schistocerca gregaria]